MMCFRCTSPIAPFRRSIRWRVSAAPCTALPCETPAGAPEPFPGIPLLATPGHTRGHQSAIIATREGRVVLAGQAVYSVAEWRGEADPGDRSPKSLASAKRLRALGARRVFFGHDAARWDAA